MCFGTFDRLHEGHRFYLRESRKLGDELIAVVSLDSTVRKVKGRPPLLNQDERLRQLASSGLVDKAVLGGDGDKLEAVLREKPEILALGYDQTAFTGSLAEKLKKQGIEARIVRIRPFHPERYKSSILNRRD